MTCLAKFKYLYFAYLKTSRSFIFFSLHKAIQSTFHKKKKQSRSTKQHHTIQKPLFPTALKSPYEKKAPQLIKWNINVKRRIKRQRRWLQTTYTATFSKDQVVKDYNHVQWLYMALASVCMATSKVLFGFIDSRVVDEWPWGTEVRPFCLDLRRRHHRVPFGVTSLGTDARVNEKQTTQSLLTPSLESDL